MSEQNANQFHLFLKILTKYDKNPEGPVICWQGFPDDPDEENPTGIKFFRLDDLDAKWAQLVKNNSNRRTVSVAVNELDSTGRARANVTRIRAQCIDIDTHLDVDTIKLLRDTLKPTMLVLSSTDKTKIRFKSHFYWIYPQFEPAIEQKILRNYTILQRAFALRAVEIIKEQHSQYENLKPEEIVDFSIYPEKALRAPGFLHQKKMMNVFVSQLAHVDESSILENLDDSFASRGITAEHIEQANESVKSSREKLGRDTSDPLVSVYKGVSEGNRRQAMMDRANELFLQHHNSYDGVAAILMMENERNDPPLDERELEQILNSAFEYYDDSLSPKRRDSIIRGDGISAYAEFQKLAAARSDRISSGEAAESTEEAEIAKRIAYDYADVSKYLDVISDSAIMHRVVERNAGLLLGNPEEGLYVYDSESGKYVKKIGLVRKMLNDVIVDMSYEPLVRYTFTKIAKDSNDDPIEALDAKAMQAFFVQARSANKMRSMLSSLETLDEVYYEVVDFDTQTHFLNTPDGVVNLRNGKLRPHNPKYRMRLSTSVGYDDVSYKDFMELESPADWRNANRWTRFVYEIMNGDVEMCRFVQTAAGYSLLGELDAQCLFYFEGGGSNGKSAFLEAFQEALGTYSASPSKNIVVEDQRASDIARMSELAQLHGLRCIVPGEIGERDKLNLTAIKDITTGAKIVAKMYGRDPSKITPQFTTFLHGNNKPNITATDYGIWRRILMVPCMVKFSGKQLDRGLKGLLKNDPEIQRSILPWAVAGTQIYLKEGIVVPESSEISKQAYIEEMQPVVKFIRECLITGVRDDEHHTTSDELYSAYLVWCGLSDVESVGKVSFGRGMNVNGLQSYTGRDAKKRSARKYPCMLNEEWTSYMRDPAMRQLRAKEKIVDMQNWKGRNRQ